MKLQNVYAKNILNHNSDIFDPLTDEILSHVSTACAELGIDYYLAGAVARDYHLSQSDGYLPKRKTADIDFAVIVPNEDSFIALKENIVGKGDFKYHGEPIKLIYKDRIEVDLLPCGQIEQNGETRLTKPKVFVMDVPGFALLNNLAIDVAWSNTVNARVSG